MASVIDDVLELASILRPAWAQVSESIPIWHPRCEGDDDAADADGDDATDSDATDGTGDDTADAADGSGADHSDDSGDDSQAKIDWRQMARKHEREAKKARKERDDNAARLKAREDADKSEQEKAVEEAEKKGREAAETSFEKERRQDRLELATTKLATKGLTIGEGDDAKTVKFADAEDALLHLERDIRSGDLDTEDIFDQHGKVRSDRLEEALTELLARKPHLAAGDVGKAKVAGSADAGKGTAAKPESTVEDHLKKIRRHKEGQQLPPQYAVGRQV